MKTCSVQRSGAIELLFYDELAGRHRAFVEQHLTTCAECRQALEDMSVIRAALAARPDVSAPPGGEWSAFMARLDEAILIEAHPRKTAEGIRFRTSSASTRYATYLAMAALLTLVTLSVAYVGRTPGGTTVSESGPGSSDETQRAPGPALWSLDAAFASLSEQHFERSKLVVLGLANTEPRESGAAEWAYERQLASTLLTDTRLYRLAAEERGMTNIARVLGDLEIVLLQTSMSEKPDRDTLEQIQRLIHKRDLVTKMQVVKTVAGL
jgi:hypothetical protein